MTFGSRKSHFTSSGRVLFLKFAGLLLHLFCLPQISFKSGSFSGIGLCTQRPGEKQTDDDENGIWPMFCLHNRMVASPSGFLQFKLESKFARTASGRQTRMSG